MIPDFESNGFLPPGIYLASLEEFEKRFATTIIRKLIFQNILKLIKDIKTIGCTTLYIDGSYTTTKRLPNDVDICWEDQGIDYDNARKIMPILFDFANGRLGQQIEYMADIFPAHFIESASGVYFIDFFQQDTKTGISKGIIQINI